MNPFHGTVVPMLTPLTAAGEIDRGALVRYVDFLLASGVNALFALSSTGEFCSLPWRSQCVMVEATLAHAGGRVALSAGVSTQSLAGTVQRARELAALGVHAVVSLPPFYFRTSQSEMYAWFAKIADASPVPLIVYNMPFRTQHNLEPETVHRLRAHGSIIGLKDSVNDRERTRELATALRGQTRFTYLHGSELLTLEAAAFGAHGCVPSIANLAPRFFSDAFAAAASGEPRPGDQERIAGLMGAFGLFEDRPQDSTTLRLMALKAVLHVLGIMEPYMVQLAPPLPDEWLTRARAFVEQHGLGEAVPPAPA
ncbi:MAG: dihydrodipicolinate synthase family protein [Acidobacteria bacterium]|nr:dihydrodipicolinate synthase family protein [Acidobacteriota bacterium]